MVIATYMLSLISNWSKSFVRFPLFILGCMLVCVYFSYIQYDHQSYESKIAMPLILSLGSIFLAYVVSEVFQLNEIKKWALLLTAIGIGVLYYFCLPITEDYQLKWPGFTFITLLLIFHLAYAIVPFYKNKNEDGFLRFNVNVLENFTESSFLCLILFGLLILALYALKTLFGMPYSGRSTMHLFIWIAGFVHSINFLSTYPSLPVQSSSLHKYTSRFYKILVLYISIPVMLLYCLITLAYIIKISFGGNYEPWIIAMCGWYIAIGLVVYLFNKLYLKDNESTLALMYDKYFAAISLPIVGLFIYCIVKNVDNDGVNISNYYSILLAIIAVTIFCLININKRLNLVWLPTIVSIGALFSIVPGPLNVWSYPASNQKQRLLSAMQNIGSLKNETINFDVKIDSLTSLKLEKNIYAVESNGDLNFLKKYDKLDLLSDTIMSYELIEKLNLYKGLTNKLTDSRYYDFIPIIKLYKGSEIYPVINKYVNAQKDYSGIRVGLSGSLYVIQKGLVIDSIILSISVLKSQKITTISQIKKDTFDLYINGITFEPYGDQCKVEDFTGIVVKRQ